MTDAIREGYAINLPTRTLPAGAPVAPLVTVDSADVVVEAVKLAEDRSGDVVVRLYAATGGRATTTVRAGFAATAVESVDLLERPLDLGQTWPEPSEVLVQLGPFQILTLRYRRG
jgi:alpha-mannosidase